MAKCLSSCKVNSDTRVRILNETVCNVSKKLATIVEGDPRAPFSKATTPRFRGGCYSIPWIAPLYALIRTL